MTNDVQPKYNRFADTVDAIHATNARIRAAERQYLQEQKTAIQTGSRVALLHVNRKHRAAQRKQLNGILQNHILRNFDAVHAELMRLSQTHPRDGGRRLLHTVDLRGVGTGLMNSARKHQKDKYGVFVDWPFAPDMMTAGLMRRAYNEVADSIGRSHQIVTYAPGVLEFVVAT